MPSSYDLGCVQRKPDLPAYIAHPDIPYLKPLFTMLQGSVGMLPTLKDGLEHLKGIQFAYIYGSFAKN